MALDMFCVLRLLLEHSSLYLVVDREREEIEKTGGGSAAEVQQQDSDLESCALFGVELLQFVE